ncbi:MAG: YbfB/YjiJ family MFS transporter [Caldimonas sp.]
MSEARALPTLVVAAALGLGTAVSLGLARFAYALLLPAMRADLGWSYLLAGAMNTVNAAGYLAGALIAPSCLERADARSVFIGGSMATAAALLGHGLVTSDPALFAVRFLAGVVSAVAFIAGGLLATRLAAAAMVSRSGRSASAGLVLGMYYGGTGLGIFASAIVVPWFIGRTVAHAWQGAWIALAALAVAATLAAASATRTLAQAVPPAAARERRRRFAWAAFTPALVAYLLFGVGYIGYMTFVITLLRDEHVADRLTDAFFAMLGLAVVVSPWLWARVLQRFRGGVAFALLSALLAVATLIPVLGAQVLAVFASGLLFGGVFLSLVASTTSLIRHNLVAAEWPAAIAAFTIVFAAGQIVGPSLVGLIADHFGGLRAGFAFSSAVLALGALAALGQRPLTARTT